MKHTTEVAGLPGGPLVTDYPIRETLVPKWMTNNRPGYKAQSPRRSVQHGNGNPNAYAAADARWLQSGASGGQVSFHSTADDMEVHICVPADEVTWQAADGDGPGNFNGYSCEMSEHAAIWSDEARKRKCVEVTADFMGRVAARLNIAIPEQHWTFNFADPGRHDCPNKLRHQTIGGRPAWDVYVEIWTAAKADELRRMGGIPKPTPQPVKPFPIPWTFGATGPQKVNNHPAIAFKIEVEVKKPVYLKQGADGKAKRGKQLQPGDKAIAYGMIDGGTRYLVIDPGDGQPWRAVRHAFEPKYIPIP